MLDSIGSINTNGDICSIYSERKNNNMEYILKIFVTMADVISLKKYYFDIDDNCWGIKVSSHLLEVTWPYPRKSKDLKPKIYNNP